MLQEWHLCVKKMCQYNFSQNVLREMASALCSDGCNLVNKKVEDNFHTSQREHQDERIVGYYEITELKRA